MPRTARAKKRRSLKKRLPRLFGHGLRDAILVFLAVNGPHNGSEIGQALGLKANALFEAVQDLTEMGLIVKGRWAGGVKPVALNRALPIYGALRRLLLAMDRHWPIARAAKRRPPADVIPYNMVMSERLLQQIFISPIRTRVLLYIATSRKTPLSTTSHALKAHRMSVLSAVNLWEHEGVIRSEYIDGKRMPSLNPEFVVSCELRSLIKILANAGAMA